VGRLLRVSKLSAPITPRLDDADAERVRREHEQKLVEVQSQPFVGASIVSGRQLADGVATPIPHGLGRRPAFVFLSIIRGAASAGFIVESSRDDKYVTLTASGYGATITIDLGVL